MADVIESIASIPNTTENFSEVWAVINRENGRMIERMAPRQIISTDGDDVVALIEHQIRLDSCVTYNASSAIRTGLSHLEGLTVSVLGDGKVLDDEIVNNSSITASSVHTYGIVGLPFYSDLQTLDLSYPMQTGNSMGVKKKTGNIMFSFVDSFGGNIGQDEDSLYEAFTDLVSSHNASELIFTPSTFTFVGQDMSDVDPYLLSGSIRRPLGASWNKRGNVFFRQSKPVPVHITSIVPEVNDAEMPV